MLADAMDDDDEDEDSDEEEDGGEDTENIVEDARQRRVLTAVVTQLCATRSPSRAFGRNRLTHPISLLHYIQNYAQSDIESTQSKVIFICSSGMGTNPSSEIPRDCSSGSQ